MTPSKTKEPPKAVIFDLLTALLDSWTLWDSCAGSEARGRAWRGHYMAVTFGQGRYAPYPELVRRAAAMTPGLPEDAADALLRRWDELEPWGEAPGVLRGLRAKGFKVGVYTNCAQDLGRRAAGRATGVHLDGVEGGFEFDAVLTAEEVGWYKPDPRAYAAIAEALGVTAEECVFVAGSAGDVVGATDAGMRVVWHNRVGLEAKKRDDGSVVEPEAEGRDLSDLLARVGVL